MNIEDIQRTIDGKVEVTFVNENLDVVMILKLTEDDARSIALFMRDVIN